MHYGAARIEMKLHCGENCAYYPDPKFAPNTCWCGLHVQKYGILGQLHYIGYKREGPLLLLLETAGNPGDHFKAQLIQLVKYAKLAIQEEQHL